MSATPVSAHCVIGDTAPCADRIQRILGVIDGVHLDGDLDSLGILGFSDPGGFGYYDVATNQIALEETCHELESSLTHEIGHAIDIKAFGNGLSVCATSAEFDTWRKAIGGSYAHQRLIEIKKSRSVQIEIRGQVVQRNLDDRERRHVSYLLEWQELWARSYSQFIAARSRDKELLQQLRDELTSSYGRIYQVQWTDEDFAAIELAIEGVLKARNWLV